MHRLLFALLLLSFTATSHCLEPLKRVWNHELKDIQCLYDDPRKKLMDCGLTIKLPLANPMLDRAYINYSNINDRKWTLYLEHTEKLNSPLVIIIDNKIRLKVSSNVYNFYLDQEDVDELSKAEQHVQFYINKQYNVKIDAKYFNRLVELKNIVNKGYVAPPSSKEN
ncbi:MAG: hypothetical protein HWE11_13445 [Gammaproteobacteria bacterium]|nr:hypothetical protein [Gammaproteobacteria bacterium]